ncbi:universal stress protein [Halonotius roseus]|uniref:Universal stress protein n=1 Tax=Halonotius roseus TaxID=2511997 RepID=A0A544QLC4_9EURY|nr:universal stress protein [Halonotius roseus]TQQ79401.1 universal stress protein [Halonotius roseus]
MFDRILFPIDDSDGVAAVRDSVYALAAAHDATLHVLNVADTAHDSVTRIGDQVVDALEQAGEQIVDETAAKAAEQGIPTETAVIQGGVAATITTYAETAEIDLIVMPTQGRTGIEERLLGSTTERVSRETPVPLLTLRPDAAPLTTPIERLLVPTDGSDTAAGALDVGIELAVADGSTLQLLSIIDTGLFGGDLRADQYTESLTSAAERIIDDARDRATAAGVADVVTAVEDDESVAGGIRSYAADADSDCIVVGTHGRTGLDRYLLGSVTETLIRTAPVPVLVVPPTEHAAEE